MSYHPLMVSDFKVSESFKGSISVPGVIDAVRERFSFRLRPAELESSITRYLGSTDCVSLLCFG